MDKSQAIAHLDMIIRGSPVPAVALHKLRHFVASIKNTPPIAVPDPAVLADLESARKRVRQLQAQAKELERTIANERKAAEDARKAHTADVARLRHELARVTGKVASQRADLVDATGPITDRIAAVPTTQPDGRPASVAWIAKQAGVSYGQARTVVAPYAVCTCGNGMSKTAKKCIDCHKKERK